MELVCRLVDNRRIARRLCHGHGHAIAIPTRYCGKRGESLSVIERRHHLCFDALHECAD
jgi:hypothetical protein